MKLRDLKLFPGFWWRLARTISHLRYRRAHPEQRTYFPAWVEFTR